jgi:hypothetical protein
MPKRKAPTNVRKAALSFVEPFGLGVAKLANAQWRLSAREQQRPTPIVAGKAKGRRR